MIYKLCKRVIETRNYERKEEMQNKLDVFFLGNRMTEEEYKELTELLESI